MTTIKFLVNAAATGGADGTARKRKQGASDAAALPSFVTANIQAAVSIRQAGQLMCVSICSAACMICWLSIFCSLYGRPRTCPMPGFVIAVIIYLGYVSGGHA